MQLRMSVTEGAGIVMAWPALCARAYGHYAREGLDVELVVLSESDATASLVSGAVPLARRGADPHLEVIDGGAPVRIVAGLVAKPPLQLFARAGVRTVADLRGEPLAGVMGASASAMYLRMVLADGGLAEGDCIYRDVGRASNRYTALRSGEVTAALLSPPASARAAADGLALVCNLAQAYPRLPYAVLEANVGAEHAEPATLIALMRAEIRALRWLLAPANAPAAIAELVRATGMTVEDAAAAHAEMVVRDRAYSVDLDLRVNDVASLIAALRRYGGRRPALLPSSYLDRTFMGIGLREVG